MGDRVRKSRAQRIFEVYNAVLALERLNIEPTMYAVARAIGLQPSMHVMSYLWQLVDGGMLDWSVVQHRRETRTSKALKKYVFSVRLKQEDFFNVMDY